MKAPKINNKLANNLFSLLVLQGSNYLFPLITFPYLVRTLGVDHYGVYVLCLAIMLFLNVFIDYGFNISATRQLSRVSGNKEKVSALFNLVMTCKLILTGMVGVLYLGVVWTVPYFAENRLAFSISFLILVGNTLFPLWLYQGLEQMKYITYIHIAVKTTVTVMIFVFIRSAADLNMAVFFQTLFYLGPGLVSVWFVRWKFQLSFSFITDRRAIQRELTEGRPIFMTNLWITFYKQGPLLLLGFLVGNVATGNYGIGQRIQGAFFGLSQPMIQAVYPHMSRLHDQNERSFHSFKRKLLLVGFGFAAVVAVLLAALAPYVVWLVTGAADEGVVLLVRLFALVVFFAIVNTIISRIMHAMNRSTMLNATYSKAAIMFAATALPLTLWLQETGMALAVILSEGTVLLLNVKNVKQKTVQTEQIEPSGLKERGSTT